MPEELAENALVWFNGRVLSIGGRRGDGVIEDSIYEYDACKDQWQDWWVDHGFMISSEQLRHKRFGHCAVVAHEKLYVIGGFGIYGNTVNTVEVYNMETKRYLIKKCYFVANNKTFSLDKVRIANRLL